MATSHSDQLLVDRVRQGQPEAWNELISRYEGRLLAFVESRLRNTAASEDVVQETLIGFLNSLPNYDETRPLEGYLFSIAAHKLTDHLRREGRRPAVPLASSSDSQGDRDLPGRDRAVSSMARSGERQRLEEVALTAAMAEQFSQWRERGQWQKIQCLELLLVHGWANKDAAAHLQLTEQAVANCKFDFLARLRSGLRRQNLPPDIFPELYEDLPAG